MNTNKALAISTILFILLGIINYILNKRIFLSPGDQGFFEQYGFYLVLFSLWVFVQFLLFLKIKKILVK